MLCLQAGRHCPGLGDCRRTGAIRRSGTAPTSTTWPISGQGWPHSGNRESKARCWTAHLGKAAIRALSRGLGLDDAWPSQSCLATRFPYDTELTREDLARVGRGEAWLRRRGFSRVRLRVQGGQTRLELAPSEWPAFLAPAVRGPFSAYLAGLGFGELSLEVTG